MVGLGVLRPMNRAVGLPKCFPIDPDRPRSERCPEENMLINDIVKGRVVWTNSVIRDWWISFANEHVLFSMCLSHPIHPFSRKERVVVFVCTLMASMAAAGSLLYNERDKSSVADGDFMHKLGMSLLVAMYGMLMKAFATCGCVQNTFAEDCCEAIGRRGLKIGALISVAAWALGLGLVALSKRNFVDYLLHFGINQATSWIWAFAIVTIMFGINFTKQRKQLSENRYDRLPPMKKMTDALLLGTDKATKKRQEKAKKRTMLVGGKEVALEDLDQDVMNACKMLQSIDPGLRVQRREQLAYMRDDKSNHGPEKKRWRVFLAELTARGFFDGVGDLHSGDTEFIKRRDRAISAFRSRFPDAASPDVVNAPVTEQALRDTTQTLDAILAGESDDEYKTD
ncbi:MAG: hypothetical protein MHM6MM_004531 [Cercozoa sp. M6MM]